MEDHKTPWERLGIERDADKREIRKAYALSLKTVRPDEDPEAFQKMREARDQALAGLQFQGDFAFVEFEENDSHTDGEQQDNSAQKEQSLPFSEASEDKKVLKSDPSNIQESQARQESSETQDTPHVSADGGTLSHPSVRQMGEEGSDEDVPSFDEIVERMEGLFQSKNQQSTDNPWDKNIWDRKAWEKILSDMLLLPLYDRQDLEYELVALFSDRLDVLKQDLDTDKDHAARKEVLSLLNDEFGWLENDQMIYNSLSYEKADQFLDFILSGAGNQANRSMAFNGARVTQDDDDNDVPSIDIDDLKAFFNDKTEETGSKTPFAIRYYLKSRLQKEWAGGYQQYHLGAFLFTYVWTAWRGLWGTTAFLLFLSFVGWMLLLSGQRVYWLLEPLGFFMIATQHLLPLVSAQRWLIKRANSTAIEADKRRIFEKGERAGFIRKVGAKRVWLWLIPIMVLGMASRKVPQALEAFLSSQEISQSKQATDYSQNNINSMIADCKIDFFHTFDSSSKEMKCIEKRCGHKPDCSQKVKDKILDNAIHKKIPFEK